MQPKVLLTLFLLLAILVGLVSTTSAQGPVPPQPTPPPRDHPATAPGSGRTAVDSSNLAARGNDPESLPPGITAVADAYSFSASSDAYTEIDGGNLLTTSCDDSNYNGQDIGFAFVYDMTAYSQVSIQCNGYVAMGPWVYNAYNPISDEWGSDYVISPLGADLQTNEDAEIRYELLGDAPNRVLVIQWKNMRQYHGSTSEIYNFQIRLYETSNVIEFVYGPFAEDSDLYPEVGLRGYSHDDFYNRMADETHFWANPMPGITNTAAMVLQPAVTPPDGLVYSWTPRLPGPNYDPVSIEAPAQVVLGDPITYTISFSNTGEFTGTGTLMTDTLPAGTTYRAGTLWCSWGSCSYDAGSNSILWAGDMAAGAGVQARFAVDTGSAPCGSLLDVVTIVDPATGNRGRAGARTEAVFTAPGVDYGFDPESWPPDGWSIYDRDGGEPIWVRNDYEPHGGTGVAYHDYGYPDNQDGWLVTPPFTVSLGMQLIFWQRDDYDPGDYYYTHSVQLTTDPSPDPDLSTYVSIWDGDTAAAGDWEQTILDLSTYVGQQVYVAFRYEGTNADDWYIDDVRALAPWYPCPVATLGPSQADSACRAQEVTYSLVAGQNYLTDTFDLAISGNSWPAAILPTVTVPLAGQAPFTVTVHVPWDAAVLATGTVTVDSSGWSYGLAGQAVVTTTAIDTGWDILWDELPAGPSLYWGHSYYEHGNVCVVGGIAASTGEPTGTHSCYDIDTGAWFSRAPLPTPVFAGAYGLIHDKFYVAGGFYHPSFYAIDQLQIYDPATDTWDDTTGARMPGVQGGQAGGVVDGKLYSAGSAGLGIPSDCRTYEYDPATNSWATRASCPLPNGYGFSFVGSVGSSYHHRLFAGGGWLGQRGWYTYDPVADSWIGLADMPGMLSNRSPLIVEDPTTGLLYQIGGLDDSSVPHQDVYAYDYLADSWSADPPDLPRPLGGSSGPAYGSFGDPDVEGFWTIGSTDGSGSLDPFLLWEYITCPALAPDIGAPDALGQAQCADTVTTQTLAICNSGIVPLDWSSAQVTGTRSPADVPWFSVGPVTGTVLPDECQAVTVTYNSAGLARGIHPAGLALSSNDPDTPLLIVPITLTVKTPSIAISAPPLAAELCAGITVTLSFDVCSTECLLNWTVGEVAGMPLRRPPQTFLLPAMAETTDPEARAYAPARGARQVMVAGGPYYPTVYNVLVLSPDSSRGDISLLLGTLAAYPDLAVTVWDNNNGSPTAADMAPYDVVVLGNYYTWESAGLDRVAVGDALADYIDAGGTAIESEFAQSYDQWGLAGRYVADGYSPFTTATRDYPGLDDTLDVALPSHPVMQGVNIVEDYRYQQNPGLSSGGTLLATWAGTGNNAVAVNNQVVALNIVLFHTADWTGDIGTLLHNAIVWLAYQRIPWLSAAPLQGSVSQGECATVTLTLDAAGLSAGRYTAGVLVDSDDPNTPPVVLPVTMTVLPTPEVSFDYGPDAGYAPLTVYLTDTSQNAISPTWAFGDGGMGTGTAISHTYAVTGNYTVMLAVQSPSGCAAVTATAVVQVVEPDALLAGFTTSSPDCLGDTTSFTNTTAGTGTITYQWVFGDGGISTEVNPTHVYTAAGTYTVLLTTTNAEQADTATQEVVVGAAPTAGFTYTVNGLEVTFADGSTGVASLRWAFGDGTTATETNPLHVYALAGSYTVVLTATGDCGIDVFTLEVTTGVPEYTIYLPIITTKWVP